MFFVFWIFLYKIGAEVGQIEIERRFVLELKTDQQQ